jgi:hypothetical protein
MLSAYDLSISYYNLYVVSVTDCHGIGGLGASLGEAHPVRAAFFPCQIPKYTVMSFQTQFKEFSTILTCL